MRRVGFLLAWTSAAQEFCEAVHMRGLPDIQICADEDNPPSYAVEFLPAMGEGVAFNADVTAKFYGTKSVSKRIFLSTTSGGPKTLQTVSMVDLGAPQAVEVEILGDYELPWRCFRIVLRLGYRWWQFNCYDELNSQIKKKKTQTFRLSGSLPYELHVQTLEGDKAGTKSAVDLVLVGEERETEPALVRNGFRQGSTTRIVLNAADVGALTALRLTNHGHEDSWYCGSVIVRSADGTTSVFTVNKWIGQPYEAVATIPLEAKSSEAPPVDAECHTRAQDLTTYVGTQPRSVLVRCPYNCANDKYSRVLGSSLHPSPASVCACAVYDGVLSNSGGVVEMTVSPGVNKYSLDANNPTGMRALPYEPTPEQHSFSFALAKVDSPDDIDSNVRVVDPWGRLANSGRLEIRREGDEWGTVCKEGVSRKTNAEVAVVACHDLGYLTGMVEDECGNLGGQRVCGTTGYRSLAGGVLCTGAEKSLADCVYEEPSRICSDHSFDLALTCTNNPPDRE
ncbi:MAG: hypothetical protein KVP17_004053 [Porospora cf. gigantea B]|nr:MAG: hypothetical protein KVP17_004053 [Porospora cf. gigantea B]